MNDNVGLLTSAQFSDPDVADALNYGTLGGALLGAGIVFGAWSWISGQGATAALSLVPILAGGAMIVHSRSTSDGS